MIPAPALANSNETKMRPATYDDATPRGNGVLRILPCTWISYPTSPPDGVLGGANPVGGGEMSCAQVRVLAGNCKMVLHGTVIVMLFSVKWPPWSSGANVGQSVGSTVASWI